VMRLNHEASSSKKNCEDTLLISVKLLSWR